MSTSLASWLWLGGLAHTEESYSLNIAYQGRWRAAVWSLYSPRTTDTRKHVRPYTICIEDPAGRHHFRNYAHPYARASRLYIAVASVQMHRVACTDA